MKLKCFSVDISPFRRMIIRFSKHKIRWLLLLSVIVMWTVIWILEVWLVRFSHRSKVVSGTLPTGHGVNLFDRRKPTVILLYSKEDGRGYTTLNHEYFQRMNCPVTSCVVTTNRVFLPDITDYDAIVFNLKKIKQRIGKLPERRSFKQNYILFVEKPTERDCLTVEFANFFNMTMSYRTDSDIFHPNGRVILKSHGPVPFNEKNWPTIPLKPRIKSAILKTVRNKTKMAAWITGHCPGRSGRVSKHLELINSLQAQFRIDFAGPCGNLKCFSFSECLEKIEKEYKFLVHIEDTFAYNYVSSDAFFLMRFTVVPIFFGDANYQVFFPPKSHISANVFTSPEALGEVVHELDRNVIEYARHFWWKSTFYMQAYPNFCDLCQKTRKLRMSNRTRYYPDLNPWLDPINEAEDGLPLGSGVEQRNNFECLGDF